MFVCVSVCVCVCSYGRSCTLYAPDVAVLLITRPLVDGDLRGPSEYNRRSIRKLKSFCIFNDVQHDIRPFCLVGSGERRFRPTALYQHESPDNHHTKSRHNVWPAAARRFQRRPVGADDHMRHDANERGRTELKLKPDRSLWSQASSWPCWSLSGRIKATRVG